MSYSGAIDSTHIFLPKDELNSPPERLRSLFTLVSKYNSLQTVKIYEETKDMFGFPRYYRNFKDLVKEYKDLRSCGGKVDFGIRSTLRSRQRPVVEQFKEHVNASKTGFLLVAPTGSGKTVILLNFLSILGRTALVVVPRERIVRQWIERAVEHTTLKESDIGIAQQNRCDFQGKKLVVGMIHSLAKDRYPEEFKQWPGVVVWDEVHVTSAKTFSKTLSLFPSKYRIGASATPERADGLEQAFGLSLAEITLQMSGGVEVTPRILMREYLADRIPGRLSFIRDPLSRRGVIITALANDLKRNVLLALYVKKLNDSGRRTLLLSDRKEQLRNIRDILISRYGFKNEDIGIFIGGVNDAEAKRILENSPIVLATYGVASMAVDVPDLSGLVFGTPLSRVTQPVGRILRRHGGKKQPIVVDLIDLTYRETRWWANQRKKDYVSLGADLTKVSSKPRNS